MPSQARASNVSEAMSQGNLLVVDDDVGLRETVADFLAAEGYAVREAANVSEARSQIAAGAPDLILLDINMPVMNGEQFLQALRADPAHKSQLVIVVSTESSKTRIDRLKALGAGFIHKPFRPEELIRAVDAMTNREAP